MFLMPATGGPAVRTDAHRNLSLPSVWLSPYSWSGSYIYFATGTTVEGVNLFRAQINDTNWKVTGPVE